MIFFVHRFNDIDHFSPIIYKIASDTDQKILVLGINPFAPLRDDFRLKFLKNKFGVEIEYLNLISNISLIQKISGEILSRGYLGESLIENIRILLGKSDIKVNPLLAIYHLFLGSLRAFLSRFNIYKKIATKIYDIKWSDELLLKFKPSILIFDHAATSSKIGSLADTSPIKYIFISAKKMEIPTLSLPHGVPLFIKHPEQYALRINLFASDLSDYIVMQHTYWMKECLEAGLDESKSSILGLARYCSEWSSMLEKIIPKEQGLNEKGVDKLKIVYMDTGPDNYGKGKADIQVLLDKINQLEFVYLIYKPHTRRNKSHFNLSKKIENGKEINSVNLVNWADVVIGMHSSIMIEALIQNKAYISPAYFRKNSKFVDGVKVTYSETIYEQYNACWIVDSDSELISALHKLRENLDFKPYTKNNVESFLTDIVYSGEKNKDVLGVYRDYILNLVIK